MWNGSEDNGIACAIYSKGAFPLLRRISAINPIVVYYHIVSNAEVAHIKNLYAFRTVQEFTRDLEVLLKFFHPSSLQDFLGTIDGRQTLVRSSFILTFDDGLKECYEIIDPILKSYSIPATFFVCSAFVDNKELAYDHKKSLLNGQLETKSWSGIQQAEVHARLKNVGINEASPGRGLLCVDYARRHVLDEIATILEYDFTAYLKETQPYLTSEQIRDLVKFGHAVGGHSIDHPRYADLPIGDQLYQTLASVKFVKERFGIDYGAFSFPHSDAHVSRKFFRELFAAGEVDLCFGNQGLLKDSVQRNIQRFSMEKTHMPAEAILGKALARGLVKAASGHSVIKRI